jgi:hypothetical protein
MKIKALIRRGAYCPGLTSLRVKAGPVTLLLLLCLALLSLAQEPNSDALRRGQLKHMGGALRAYQIIHDGKSPAKLSDLYREGLAESLSDFVRPGGPTRITTDSEIDEKSDYTLEPVPEAKDFLVREKTPGPDGKLLGIFTDGAIKVLATSSSSEAGAKPDGGNIVVETVFAIALVVGLVAALWIYARRRGWLAGGRGRHFPEVVKRVTQAVKQFRAAAGPAGKHLKSASQRGVQTAWKTAAAGRKLVSDLKSRPVKLNPLPPQKAVKTKQVPVSKAPVDPRLGRATALSWLALIVIAAGILALGHCQQNQRNPGPGPATTAAPAPIGSPSTALPGSEHSPASTPPPLGSWKHNS